MPSRLPFITAVLFAGSALILSSCEMMSSGGMEDEENEGVRGHDVTLDFEEIRIIGDCDQELFAERGPGEFGYRITFFVYEGEDGLVNGPIFPPGLNWAASDERIVTADFVFDTFWGTFDGDELFSRSDGEVISLQPGATYTTWHLDRARYEVRFDAYEYDALPSERGTFYRHDDELQPSGASQRNIAGGRLSSTRHTLTAGTSRDCMAELHFTANERLRIRTDVNSLGLPLN